MPQVTTTHTIEQGQPVTINGVEIELVHAGTHVQGSEVTDTAIVKITREEDE